LFGYGSETRQELRQPAGNAAESLDDFRYGELSGQTEALRQSKAEERGVHGEHVPCWEVPTAKRTRSDVIMTMMLGEFFVIAARSLILGC